MRHNSSVVCTETKGTEYQDIMTRVHDMNTNVTRYKNEKQYIKITPQTKKSNTSYRNQTQDIKIKHKVQKSSTRYRNQT